MTGHDATDHGTSSAGLAETAPQGQGTPGIWGKKGTGRRAKATVVGRKRQIVPSQQSGLRGHSQEGTKVSPRAPHPVPGLCFQQQPPESCSDVHVYAQTYGQHLKKQGLELSGTN